MGPATCWPTTPDTPLNRVTSALAFAMSAPVRPEGRSYTTTAVKMFGDWIFDCRFSTCVDSALAGNHDDESFFSAPVSFPDNGPARATMISQKTTTPHLARRPLANVKMVRARLMVIPRRSLVGLPRRQHYGTQPFRGSSHILTANDCTAELSNLGEITSGDDIAGQCQTGAMSFYGDHVLPRLIDLLLRSSDTHELRARVAAGLTGEVLEIGFGSGLNVPFYPAALTRVRALAPAALGRKLAAERVAASPVPIEYIGLD